MKRFRLYLAVSWRPAMLWLLALLAVGGLLFFKLGSLTPALADKETATMQHLLSRDLGIKQILGEPLFLPYNIGIYIYEKLHLASPFVARSVSAFIGLLSVVCFYYIVSRWHTRRIALLTTMLFATSSWFLHTVRLATYDAAPLLLLLLIACGAWLNDTRRRGNVPLLIAAVVSGFLLYIPGLVWFIVAGLIWQRRRIRLTLRNLSAGEILAPLAAFCALLAPAVFAVSADISFARHILGLPDTVPQLTEVGKQAVNIPKQLFLWGPDDPTLWVGTMPLLDIFAGTMFIIGLYAYYHRLRLDRVKVLLLGLIFGSLLVIISPLITLSLLLPFVYIFVAAGVTFMLQQWFTVFPRNPIARTIGITLMVIAVLMSAGYNLAHYFVAWPNAPATRSAFSRRL